MRSREKQNELNYQLFWAAKANNADKVREAIEAGAELNFVNHDDTPLKIAAYDGYAEIVSILLDAGAKPNGVSSGNTIAHPLYFAIINDHEDVVRVMVDRDFNKPDLNVYMWHQMTPLKAAARFGCAGIVKLLLDHGARHDIGYGSSGGFSALSYAAEAEENALAVAQALVAAGADVNSVEVCGETPLHHAAEYGALDVVRLLVSRGARQDAKSTSGATPVHVAADKGHQAVVEFFREAHKEQQAALKQANSRIGTNSMFAATKGVDPEVEKKAQNAVLEAMMRERPERVVEALRSIDDELVAKLTFVCAEKNIWANTGK